MVDLVIFGHLTLDDLVLSDGTVMRQTLGGGALYAAIGARLWGCRVGLHSCVGRDYPLAYRRRIEAAGIDTAGVSAGPEHSLRLWILFEDELRKQQLPKLSSGRIEELDEMRAPLPAVYRGARGFHVAPALPDAQTRAIQAIRADVPAAIITLDIWTEPFFDSSAYLEPGFLAGVDAFLPSDKEVETLWKGGDLAGRARQLAAAGPSTVAIKRGERGSLLYNRAGNTGWEVPAVAANTVDTTGAGDAYAGGFLAGLIESGDSLEAALRGTVSASFAVEGLGAWAGLDADPAEALRRLEALRDRVRPVGEVP
jgi:ribokinase